MWFFCTLQIPDLIILTGYVEVSLMTSEGRSLGTYLILRTAYMCSVLLLLSSCTLPVWPQSSPSEHFLQTKHKIQWLVLIVISDLVNYIQFEISKIFLILTKNILYTCTFWCIIRFVLNCCYFLFNYYCHFLRKGFKLVRFVCIYLHRAL